MPDRGQQGARTRCAAVRKVEEATATGDQAAARAALQAAQPELMRGAQRGGSQEYRRAQGVEARKRVKSMTADDVTPVINRCIGPLARERLFSPRSCRRKIDVHLYGIAGQPPAVKILTIPTADRRQGFPSLFHNRLTVAPPVPCAFMKSCWCQRLAFAPRPLGFFCNGRKISIRTKMRRDCCALPRACVYLRASTV